VQGRSVRRRRGIAHRRGGREARLARGGTREYDAFLGHEMRGPAGSGRGGVSMAGPGAGRPKRKEGEWGETIETNWSRDGLRFKSDNLRKCVVGCKIEAQCKGGVRADGVSSLIVAVGKRRGSLGVGLKNMMQSWVAQQGLGVVASQWLGGRKAKAQGRGMGGGAIACHHHHFLVKICLSISAFCLDEKGCWRTSILCTHIHEFLYISHLFHFIYFIVICNI